MDSRWAADMETDPNYVMNHGVDSLALLLRAMV
jgi:hypothetical protein